MIGCRPLSDSEIQGIMKSLESVRDRTLFVLGIKSGFRISELLSLKVSQVFQYGEVVERVAVERRHMKKKVQGRTVFLHPEARALIRELIEAEGLEGHHYLFRGQKGALKPITRIQAWRIIRGAAKANKLQGKIGTHSCRKTFATKIYDKLGKDLVRTQRALGHKSIQSTVSYLSFREEDIDEAILTI